MKTSPKHFRNRWKRVVKVKIGIVCLFGLLLGLWVLPQSTDLNRGYRSDLVQNKESVPLSAGVIGDSYIGNGRNLTVHEYAQSTNASRQVSLPNNNSGTNKFEFIDTPPEWTGYRLFTSVTGLSDNKTWEQNGNITGQSPWIYDEVDYEDQGDTGVRDENCYGWYIGALPTTTTGVLFMSLGYDANTPLPDDWMDAREYSAFNQTIFVDRGTISDVKFKFRYLVNGSLNGFATMFANLNGYQKDFAVFTAVSPQNVWATTEFDIPITEIPNFFQTPSNVTIKLGINERVTGWLEGGVTQNNLYVDNVSLYLRGSAKPSQVKLKVNGTDVPDTSYGTGNLTLSGSWTNPSSTQYRPLLVNFTEGNSTDVKLTASITQFVNHTKTTQTSVGTPGSEFTIKNASNGNWTAYLYAAAPTSHEQFNFTVYFPQNWNIWALYDPNPTEVLAQPGISTSPGILNVGTIRANNFPGLWRIEFSAPNNVTSLSVCKDVSSVWVAAEYLFAGDLVNITAQISGSSADLTGTTAQLEILFPNNTRWSAMTQLKSVGTDGWVYFAVFSIPDTTGPAYIAGNYTIFVSWNNSRGATECNATGFRSTVIAIKHYAQLQPDALLISDVINGSTIKVRAMYLDIQSSSPIEEAVLLAKNVSSQVQTMLMVAPGYYSVDIYAVETEPLKLGNHNVTLNATHPFYSFESVNVTVEIVLETQVTSINYPMVTVAKNDNFTVEMQYNTSLTQDTIDGATISCSWLDAWTFLPIGTGKYQITANSSAYASNTIQNFLFSVKRVGYLNRSFALNVKIVARSTEITKIILNDIDSTISKSCKLPINSILNITVLFNDTLLYRFIEGATLSLEGTGASPPVWTLSGIYYQCFLNTASIGKGVHLLTIVANKSDYSQDSAILQITVGQIPASINTTDAEQTYKILPNGNFELKIDLEDHYFGGLIGGANVTYEWRFGKGQLTYSGADQTYYALIANVPEGSWPITIRAETPSGDYAFTEITVNLVAQPEIVEGLPPWVPYSFGALIAAILLIFGFWQTTFKYPKIIREVRAFKKQIKKGKIVPSEGRGKDVPTTFVEEYLTGGKGTLTTTQQNLLREQHLKPSKEAPVKREVTEIAAVPPSTPAELAPAPVPSVAPPQVLVKPAPEVPKPAAVTPTPTPAPVPVPTKPAEKPPAKPVIPVIAPIPEKILEFMKAKQVLAEKPLPQVKTLPAVKSLPQIKELLAKPATKPAPKPEEKPAEKAGDEKK